VGGVLGGVIALIIIIALSVALGVSDYHNVIVIVSSYGHLKKKANPKNE
jgi:hypothetical protein